MDSDIHMENESEESLNGPDSSEYNVQGYRKDKDSSESDHESYDFIEERLRDPANEFLQDILTFHDFAAVVQGEDQEEEDEDEDENENEEEEEKEKEKEKEKEEEQGAESSRRRSVNMRQRRGVKGPRQLLPAALRGLMGQANLDLVHRKYEAVKISCLEIIKEVPNSPEPYHTLSELHEAQGNTKLSFQYAMLAAQLSPNDAHQWICLGDRALELNFLPEALMCFTEAVKYDPENINAHIIKAQLLEQKCDQKAAIKAYHKLVEAVKPEHGPQILNYAKIVARYYHQQRDIQKAKEVMKLAFLKASDHVTSEDVNLYVELLIALQEYDKVLEVMARHCGVFIEGEDDVLLDNNTKEVMCSSLRVINCEIPADIPIQIHVKLIVTLIHLKSRHLLNSLLAPFFRDENVEEIGDLLIDVVEALMSEGMHIQALKLLKPLVDSKTYSVAAVWLHYADCLKNVGRLEEAASAYITVMEKAPKHADARLKASEILNELGKKDEAISVLSETPDTGSLDVVLSYEKCMLLKGNPERVDDFLTAGRLVLSRHCLRITKREDLQPLSKLKGFKRRDEAIKRLQKHVEDPKENHKCNEGKKQPTPEEEWDLFFTMCQAAYDTKQFGLLQRLAFSAMGSKVLNKTKESEVFFIALLSCYYNKDSYHGYNLARDMVLKDEKNAKAWNMFNLMIQDSDDGRHHRFIMRQLARNRENRALAMLHANNYFVTGSYKFALSEYMKAYRLEPSDLLAFLISVTILQMSCQKFSENKNSLVNQCISFMWQYKALRGEKNQQEVEYNLGRLYHQLGFLQQAIFHYKKALKTPPMEGPEPGIFDLTKEIGFNLSQIYQSTGALDLARHYIEKYVVI